MADLEDPLSDFGHESEDDTLEADLLRCESLGEMVERAVLLGVDLRMSAYIGEELVTVTVQSEAAQQEATVLH